MKIFQPNKSKLKLASMQFLKETLKNLGQEQLVVSVMNNSEL